MYINSYVNLNRGTLNVKGNLIQSNSLLCVNGGKMNVEGDYRIQGENGISYGNSMGTLQMTNNTDYVLVKGNFIVQSGASGTNMMTSGILEIKGNFTQLAGTYKSGLTFSRNNNFIPSDRMRVLLSGSQPQTVHFQNPGSSYFNILEITNTSEAGVTFASQAYVKRELVNTKSVLVNPNNITLTSNAVVIGSNWNCNISANG
jgi:hypothetical protein